MASLSQGRTAAAQCGLFTHKSVPVIFEPPCKFEKLVRLIGFIIRIYQDARSHERKCHDARTHEHKCHDARTHERKCHDARTHEYKCHDARTHELKCHDARSHEC